MNLLKITNFIILSKLTVKLYIFSSRQDVIPEIVDLSQDEQHSGSRVIIKLSLSTPEIFIIQGRRNWNISDIHENIHTFMLHISISTLLCLHNNCPTAHAGSGPGLSMPGNYTKHVTDGKTNCLYHLQSATWSVTGSFHYRIYIRL